MNYLRDKYFWLLSEIMPEQQPLLVQRYNVDGFPFTATKLQVIILYHKDEWGEQSRCNSSTNSVRLTSIDLESL